jgi:hypothetical protein
MNGVMADGSLSITTPPSCPNLSNRVKQRYSSLPIGVTMSDDGAGNFDVYVNRRNFIALRRECAPKRRAFGRGSWGRGAVSKTLETFRLCSV